MLALDGLQPSTNDLWTEHRTHSQAEYYITKKEANKVLYTYHEVLKEAKSELEYTRRGDY
jgi:hypothetical protein